jgi:hypothetical protein
MRHLSADPKADLVIMGDFHVGHLLATDTICAKLAAHGAEDKLQ